MCMKFSDLKFWVQKNTFATEKSLNFVWFRPVVCEGRVCESIEFEFISEQIRKPGTQKPRNPGPGQILKLCFVPSRTQKYDVTTWRNPSRHICTKFQENRHISGSTIKNSFETWQRHIEPGMWRNVTKMWHHIIFVTVPHSNPGPGSGEIPAWNDPQQSLDRISRSQSNQ